MSRSRHFETFWDILRHFETFQDISRHFETFRDISRHFETLCWLAAHLRSFFIWYISIYVGTRWIEGPICACMYMIIGSKKFKIGIAGFLIYGTKSEKLRFYLGSSSRNFFSPPKLKMPPRALDTPIVVKP